MGEIEASTSKPKPKPISQGLQNEIQDYQQSSGHKYNNNNNGKSNHSNGQGQKNGGNGNGNGGNSTRKERKHSKRQLFTPQNIHSNNFSPVNQEKSPENEPPEDTLWNFVAPSWVNFKFDRRAILDCLT